MWRAEIPASSNSSLVPDVGSSRTARWAILTLRSPASAR